MKPLRRSPPAAAMAGLRGVCYGPLTGSVNIGVRATEVICPMLDGHLRRIVDPPLDTAGRALARCGVSADGVTLTGLALGLFCALAVAQRHDALALALLAASRLCDGLDGALARATTPTDRGGFLDITCDFAFYGAVPLAFALRDPALNALPAAILLFAFYVNGASFLAFAVMAAKRGLTTMRRGAKSLYFTAGLAEAAETIALLRRDDPLVGPLRLARLWLCGADAGHGPEPGDSRVDNLQVGLAVGRRRGLFPRIVTLRKSQYRNGCVAEYAFR